MAARILTGVGFVVAHALSGHVFLPNGRLHLSEGLLTWDAGIYRVIAEHGYQGQPREIIRFFPVFPLMARALSTVLPMSTGAALIVIANVSALGCGLLIWHLIHDVTGDIAAADRGAVLLAIWPAGLALVFGYSEGLFLLLALASLLLIRRGRIWQAVPLLALAGATRPTGVLLALPVLLVAIRAVRSHEPVGRWIVAIAAPWSGLLAYVAWVQLALGRGGDVVAIQSQLRGGFHEPATRLLTGVGEVITGDFRQIYNVVFAIALISLVIVGFRRHQPTEWLWYLAAGLAVALAAENIDSLGRYGLALAPAWVLALGTLGRSSRTRGAIVSVLGVGFVWFVAASLLGRVIP